MPGILQCRPCKQVMYSLLAPVECCAVLAKENVKCGYEVILLAKGQTSVSDGTCGVAAAFWRGVF